MVILKTAFAFFFLLFLTRILGNKQMSQMTYFNYITGITLGTLTANIIGADSKFIFDNVSGLFIWTILTIIIALISLNSSRLKIVFDGHPIILIKDGKLVRDSLREARLTVGDLLMMLRNKNVFSIKDVDYALLEINGEVTVLKKQTQLSITKSDMNIPIQQSLYLPSAVIIDGKLVEHNLLRIGLDTNWLINELNKQKVNKISDVFYAEINREGKLYIDNGI